MTKHALKTYGFPITLQCSYSAQSELPQFISLMNLLSCHGFYGIELNLPDLTIISPKDLSALLQSYSLKLTFLATGEYAKARGLSLSSSNPELRRQSILGCKENIQYASELQAGIIIGFLKNNPCRDQETPALYLAESLEELGAYAQKQNVPLLLEATNRYESLVANSLNDTVFLLQHLNTPAVSALPDTFHMNIEEKNPLEALDIYQNYYQNLHISDNNRFFPGLGCIPFEKYFSKLKEIHYQGALCLEGIIKNSIEKDLEISVNYLNQISYRR